MFSAEGYQPLVTITVLCDSHISKDSPVFHRQQETEYKIKNRSDGTKVLFDVGMAGTLYVGETAVIDKLTGSIH